MNRVKEVEVTFEEYNQRLMDSSKYISSDGAGNYNCNLCDHTWRAYKRYLYWPVFFRWQRKAAHKLITWHGWSIGYEGLEQKVFGWTMHIGPINVCFGSVSRLPEIVRYTYKSPLPAVRATESDVLSAMFISGEQ